MQKRLHNDAADLGSPQRRRSERNEFAGPDLNEGWDGGDNFRDRNLGASRDGDGDAAGLNDWDGISVSPKASIRGKGRQTARWGGSMGIPGENLTGGAASRHHLTINRPAPATSAANNAALPSRLLGGIASSRNGHGHGHGLVVPLVGPDGYKRAVRVAVLNLARSANALPAADDHQEEGGAVMEGLITQEVLEMLLEKLDGNIPAAALHESGRGGGGNEGAFGDNSFEFGSYDTPSLQEGGEGPFTESAGASMDGVAGPMQLQCGARHLHQPVITPFDPDSLGKDFTGLLESHSPPPFSPFAKSPFFDSEGASPVAESRDGRAPQRGRRMEASPAPSPSFPGFPTDSPGGHTGVNRWGTPLLGRFDSAGRDSEGAGMVGGTTSLDERRGDALGAEEGDCGMELGNAAMQGSPSLDEFLSNLSSPSP